MNLLSLVLSALLLVAPISALADIKAPDVLIKSTVHDVLEIINKDKHANGVGQKQLFAFIDAEVLPHFNFEHMTKLAVGRPWRSASAEQKTALIAEFRTLLVRTYTRAFTAYQNVSVDTKPLTVSDTDKEVTVKTVIRRPGAPEIPVNYEMEKTDSGWKVYDVVVEGVSLVATHRGSFADKVKQSGIDGLIQSLVELNKGADSNSVSKAESK
ncbi:MAG: MlaC/ttg2D family ABC transporter substrate-binding protein [Gallionellaceae bacterium]|jgi:phospholipid transport system substrate-binding protein